MLSQTAEYALRAIVFLANQKDRPRTTAQIAEATRVPVGYLAKVMQSLGRAGLVISQRGVNGGFVLANPPQHLTLFQVVHAVDPLRRITKCPLEIPAHGQHLCPLHKKLDQATEMVEQVLRDTKVADLLAGKHRKDKACRFPLVVGAEA